MKTEKKEFRYYLTKEGIEAATLPICKKFLEDLKKKPGELFINGGASEGCDEFLSEERIYQSEQVALQRFIDVLESNTENSIDILPDFMLDERYVLRYAISSTYYRITKDFKGFDFFKDVNVLHQKWSLSDCVGQLVSFLVEYVHPVPYITRVNRINSFDYNLSRN